MTPLIVIVRDRLSYMLRCLASLEPHAARLGLDIHLVDHGSTWPPMVDWLATCPYPVHYRGNVPPRALWEWDGLQRIVGGLGSRRYLVTDPDLVLDDDIPGDWLLRMSDELTATTGLIKVGLGLRLDDLPDTDLSATVRGWELAFWQDHTPTGQAWRAPVDTTLALYQPLSAVPGFALHPAARLDAPYLARHLPWYGDLDPAETDHYRTHALPGTSHWINGGW